MKINVDEIKMGILKKYCIKENILDKLEIGIERESLRIKGDKIADTNHPTSLEPKESHKYITVDYGESQVEFITPVFTKNKELLDFLENTYDIFANEIGDEFLWPYSLPCEINNLEEIREASFLDKEKNIEYIKYRKFLTSRYGKKLQLISGIHFNFSFSNEMMKDLHKIANTGETLQEYNDRIYMKIARSYESIKHLVVLLFGATPVAHRTFAQIDNAVSIRNSEFGYKNKESLNLNYKNKETFVASLKECIDKGIIDSERENYSSIRLKTASNKVIKNLLEEGIKYIEVRNIDLNPYEKVGINEDTLNFMKLLLLFCAVESEIRVSCQKEEQCRDGMSLAGDLIEKSSKECSYLRCSSLILQSLLEFCDELNLDNTVVKKQIEKVENKDFLFNKISNDIKKVGYTNLFTNLGKQYKKNSYNNRFKYLGKESMELSTQILIKESIKENIEVEVMDLEDNFIKLSRNGVVEYVKQATKTSKDNYITVLSMENKVITKKILVDNNIKTPVGENFTEKDLAIKFAEALGSNYVIKPKSTNFGIGINIFTEKPDKKALIKAIDIAFDNDKTILIEEYIKGLEYRFLTIGDEVAGILHRAPANVTGNGINCIKELVEEKNLDSLRGTGYKTPLEKIVIDTTVKMHLEEQGIDENYIPKKGDTIYLRVNSNISTGGDSIDLTDEVHNKFKKIAVDAAKSVKAVFCGVDIIIEDYTNPNSNYSIIELNFNPAIHIHSFPYKGKERKIAIKVLKALGY